MRQSVSVVVAHESCFLGSLLARLCRRAGITVLGETPSGSELARLTAALTPDVAITGCRLREGPAEAWLPALRAAGAAVLVVCGHPSPEGATTVLAGGAAGLLHHESRPLAVVEAVRALVRGEAMLHPAATSALLAQWRTLREDRTGVRAPPQLTPRELQVLGAMVEGLATKGIARRLGVAPKTVENHKVRIFDKLGARNHAHAVSLAVGSGLVPFGAEAEPAAAVDGSSRAP